MAISRLPLRIRSAFTLVELLVVIAVIGIMVGLLLPAVQNAREAARRMSCSNHQRQLGLALHNYHAAYDRLPAGWIANLPSEGPGWSWGSAILPFMEEQAVHEKINFSVSIDNNVHQTVREQSIGTFICPSDVGANLFSIAKIPSASGTEYGNQDEAANHLFLIAKANYVGVYGTLEIDEEPFDGDGTFYGNSKTRMRDFLDGTSSTIMLGERSTQLGSPIWHGLIPEATAAEARFLGTTDHTPNAAIRHFDDFSSQHAGGAYFTMADGSVRLITQFIDLRIYQALATRHNHEVVQATDF